MACMSPLRLGLRFLSFASKETMKHTHMIAACAILLLSGCSNPSERERVVGAIEECTTLLDVTQRRIEMLEQDAEQHRFRTGQSAGWGITNRQESVEFAQTLGALTEAHRHRDILKMRIIQLRGDLPTRKTN